MIKSSIESLFESINNSKEYKDYKEISSILNGNIEVKELIEEIKILQKKATKLEHSNDDSYKDVDKEIAKKTEILNNNKDYQRYLSKLKEFNNVLLTSSSLIEDYIDEKITV